VARKNLEITPSQKLPGAALICEKALWFARSMSESRLAAQDDMLAAMMTPSNG
jgi:hypothetical protein